MIDKIKEYTTADIIQIAISRISEIPRPTKSHVDYCYKYIFKLSKTCDGVASPHYYRIFYQAFSVNEGVQLHHQSFDSQTFH
ncbi:hypothetical protein C3B51_21290 [Pseudoalteromonas rubra]|uniref:Uncharacterized protein n=1 Tax=Pseudoalteromonas rubra TaxID=43658 RepID=A0A4Q7DZ23_9GAMM|nr:hypothetical protein C3B51_21290 [Pseudoalteromonas rubra]